MSYDPTKPYKKRIFDLIKGTWKTDHLQVEQDIYPIFTEKVTGQKVDHTDGLGTKGEYHWHKKTFKEAVIDALAMNLNDLAMVRAIPYKLQNHIVIPDDNHVYILEIIKCLSEECINRKIAMTGGETSIHNNTNALDISITVSGYIPFKRPRNQCLEGDTLIGIKSSGLHSNGFTKVRQLFKDEDKPEFTTPTRIYHDDIIALCNEPNIQINGMMHITGGAFTKLRDVIRKVDLKIDHQGSLINPQEIFFEIYKRGVTDEEMYSSFNCGVGFVLSVPKEQATTVLKRIEGSFILGSVDSGTGQINIQSAFSKKVILL